MICPTRDELKAFLQDASDGAVRDRVESHLSGCSACQARLDELAQADEPDWSVLRRADDAAPSERAFLAELRKSAIAGIGRALSEERGDIRRGSGQAPNGVTDDNGGARLCAVAVPGYEILEELGRGGMGVVYKARQIGLNRITALKMIAAGTLADAESRARLRTETEAAAQIQHPNIVQVFEVGEQDGQPYFSMEYAAGGSLARQLRGRPMPPRAAAAMVATLARALQVAHEHGIIHRDLKPSNVLLSLGPKPESDATGVSAPEVRTDALGSSRLNEFVPKLADFGTAKRLGDIRQTRTGQVLGTPSYAAPEQISPRRGDIGPGADVYGLGAVLYELLTGRPPFVGDDVTEVVMQVLHEDAIAPRRLHGGVPNDLETIALKCLQKEPRQRYGSARELADDLERFLACEPIRARPISWRERAVKWVRRRPAIASLLASLMVVTVLGFAGVTWQWQRAATHATAEAAASREAARRRTDANQSQRRAEIALYCSRVSQAYMHWQADNASQARLLLEMTPREFRRWEWQYLWRLCHSETANLRHGYWVQSVAYSPDGRSVAVAAGTPENASADAPRGGELKLWDARTGELIRSFDGHAGRIARAVFSRDGRRLVSAGETDVRVWDVESGDLIHRFAFPIAPRELLGNGRLIERVGDQPQRLWDLASGEQSMTLESSGSPFHTAACSPDGTRAATFSRDGTIRIWDCATGRVLRSFIGEQYHIALFSPDGRYLAAAEISGNAPIKIWDVESGVERWSLTTAGVGTKDLQFSADGRALAAVLWNRVRVWELEDEPLSNDLGQVGEIYYHAAFSPDHRYVAVGGANPALRVWEVKSGTEIRVFRGHDVGVHSVAFSPDGRQVASGGQDGSVKIWDLTRDQQGSMTESVGEYGEYLVNFAFRDDGRRLVAVHVNALREWDVESSGWQTRRQLAWRGGYLTPRSDIAFSDDGRLIVAAGDALQPTAWHVFDAATGEKRTSLVGHQAVLRGVAISHDSARIATVSHDDSRASVPDANLSSDSESLGELKIWDAARGKELRAWHCPSATAIGLNPDGSHVALGSSTGRVNVRDTETGRELFGESRHNGPIHSLAFSPDRRSLASVGFDDGRVILWNLRRPSQPLDWSIRAPWKELTCIRFSPDGSRLAVVGYTGQVLLLDVATGNELLTMHPLGPRRLDNYAYPARVVFSPDGRRLASNNWDGSLNIWDASGGG